MKEVKGKKNLTCKKSKDKNYVQLLRTIQAREHHDVKYFRYWEKKIPPIYNSVPCEIILQKLRWNKDTLRQTIKNWRFCLPLLLPKAAPRTQSLYSDVVLKTSAQCMWLKLVKLSMWTFKIWQDGAGIYSSYSHPKQALDMNFFFLLSFPALHIWGSPSDHNREKLLRGLWINRRKS